MAIKTIHIREWINERIYDGDVTINTETLEVDFGDLDVSGNAYYKGNYLCTIEDIIRATTYYELDLSEDVGKCYETGLCGFMSDMSWVIDCNEYVFDSLTTYFQDERYRTSVCYENSVRDEDGTEWVTAPQHYWNDMYYCEDCHSYIDYENYYGNGTCVFCHEDKYKNRVIEGYCESHEHDPVFFGEYEGKFCGLGVELEVDCDHSQKYQNEEVASSLCSHCGLEYNEVRFAEDGSLDNGFENIIEAHTVKDFWAKQDKWKKMLKYLSDNGYKSHDTNTCGLHVHVSRTMFGKTEEEQTTAIAKVYTFFDENWDEIVKISRRKNFRWSGKNDIYKDNSKSNYENWKNEAKKKNGGHDVALNNSNRNTFEYRLGRGTLNSWSFFSWIDFILTISKNAKRITVKKIQSNDLVSWFSGIKESSAKYIYKRGAFRETMLALFPNIEWETDLVENQ